MKTKLLTLFCCLMGAATMLAYDAAVGGLYYNLNSTNNTATVTFKSTDVYTYNSNWNIQTADIPSTITVSGINYTVTSIGTHAFSQCSKLTSVTIPNSVTSIENVAFSQCSKLTSVTIPNSVTSIGEQAFYKCSKLTSVTISSNVTSIESWTFGQCTSLTSIEIPNSVTNIAGNAFTDCTSLTSIEIPNSVTRIGDSAFQGCTGLASVTIGNGVKTIENNVFKGCTGLASVTIGNSVTNIGDYAFGECNGITTITVNAETPPTIQTSTFDGLTKSNILVYVPQQWIPLYKYDPEWRQFNIQGIDATGLSFTVTWKNYDGSVLETDENIAGGTIPTYNGATPTKSDDAVYTYTFAGWSPTVTTVTGEITYIATFTATFKANTYTIHVNQDCTSYME